MVEPQYKPGWENIDDLIAKRDRENKDPNCGPAPATGYARFMWIRSRWGWEIDQWAQHRRIHDSSSAWRDSDGVLRVYCSCGLVVSISGTVKTRWSRNSGLHNFHAPDRDVDFEFDREFFSAQGHRDPYFGTTNPSFVARIAAHGGPKYHLWCIYCGDRGEISVFRRRDGKPSRKRIDVAIMLHDLACPSNVSTEGNPDA